MYLQGKERKRGNQNDRFYYYGNHYDTSSWNIFITNNRKHIRRK